ncbi:hypothetical protein [Pseudobacteroides cellulosolvens]|uniref:Peptidase domain protein n=1 Tax=Pseudobacteroides cellulosolvens ATCC 35603 = DSM 2933 TaxID=398512 RepID=A0A0L6JLN7_9FIRM|nr:hypothetical protein [Pseudobacteroides cellulosolvens]KNY26721.1 hypothetical protein Bccel_1986 [Pseudobacteroides cellulosolvens ATCC 35603 = DSM 2933]
MNRKPKLLLIYLLLFLFNQSFISSNSVFAYVDDHGNDTSTATLIQIGQEIEGMIDAAGDVDYFKFIPSLSGYYSIESTGSTNVVGGLFNDINNNIKSDNDSGYGSNFYMACYLESNKCYYVRASNYSYSGTGAYGIKLTQLPDDYRNEPNLGGVVPVDNETSGNLDYPCDIDCFKFTTINAGPYIIESTGLIDLYGSLTNVSGSSVPTYYANDISSIDKNFRIKVTLAANTIYNVYVRHNSVDKDATGIGAYTLKVITGVDDHGNNSALSTNLILNQEIPGNIETGGDIDYFKFVPGTSGYYAFESSGSTDVEGRLYDSLNSLIASDSSYGIGNNFDIVKYLESNKTYYLRVIHYLSSGIGVYGIKVTSLMDDYRNEFENASSVVIGSQTNGEINYVGDFDIFKFTTQVTGPYIIQSSGTTNLTGSITNTVGSSISAYIQNDINSTDKNFKIAVTLEANKTYYVQVRHNNGGDRDNPGTGRYSLSVSNGSDDHGNSIMSATYFEIGQDTQGNIETGGDIDYFKFVPNASGYYGFESTGSTNVDGWLYDYLNTVIASDSSYGIGNNFSIIKYLEANKTYYLRVAHSLSSGIGTYVIKVTSLADDYRNEFENASSVVIGSQANGEINYTGDIDVLRFTTQSSGTYVIQSSGTTDLIGTLTNAAGSSVSATIQNNISSTDKNFRITATLEANKTYCVLVRHNNGGDKDAPGTGVYSLTVMF